MIIFYPHTSNWDFVIGLLARAGGGLHAAWVGKDTLFRWPFGAVLRRMGGIPVNRRERTGLVAQLAAQFRSRDALWLVIAPEGTRSRAAGLKSGFYRLAREVNVPLGLGFIDYRTRVAGVASYLELTGDEETDLARMRAFYADKVGKYPAQASPIRFRHGREP